MASAGVEATRADCHLSVICSHLDTMELKEISFNHYFEAEAWINVWPLKLSVPDETLLLFPALLQYVQQMKTVVYHIQSCSLSFSRTDTDLSFYK